MSTSTPSLLSLQVLGLVGGDIVSMSVSVCVCKCEGNGCAKVAERKFCKGGGSRREREREKLWR